MPNGNGRNGNGRNGRNGLASPETRPQRRRELEKQYAAERKAKEPTVASSLKAGVKSAFGRGMAGISRERIKSAKAREREETRKIMED